MPTIELPNFEPDVNDVLREIQYVLQQMYVAGAVDDEGSRLQALAMNVERGTISPADAWRELNTIATNRQDYH